MSQTLGVMRSWFTAKVGSAELVLVKVIEGPVQMVGVPAQAECTPVINISAVHPIPIKNCLLKLANNPL